MRDRSKIRVGLALGSGAARGWAHIGVLQALGELGVKPDVICGTSIGALVGGFHLTGQLETLEHWTRRLNKLKLVRYLDVRLTGSGVIAGNRLFRELERTLSESEIESLPVPFAIVATDLHTGQETWLTEGPLAPAIRASFSLPGLFEPVRIDDRWLVDGALVNPVPVSVCHALGARIVIAVNLNATPMRLGGRSPIGGAEAGRHDPGASLIGGMLRPRGLQFLTGKMKKNADPEPEAPGLVSVLASTLNLVQDRVTRSRLAADPPDIHIVPKVGHIGLLDFHAASECIEAGAAAVYHVEAEIHEALTLFEEFAT